MDHLIKVIHKAKGFTTYLGSERPDNGSDIITGEGLIGFESSRICVEVKIHDSAVGRTMLDV